MEPLRQALVAKPHTPAVRRIDTSPWPHNVFKRPIKHYAEIGSVPFKAIVGSVEDTNNPALRATVMVPCEYNVPTEQRYSLFYHGKGEMIDHVIVSQALYPHWVETAVFNELLPDKSIAFATAEKFPRIRPRPRRRQVPRPRRLATTLIPEPVDAPERILMPSRGRPCA